jgi:hypothetical protein
LNQTKKSHGDNQSWWMFPLAHWIDESTVKVVLLSVVVLRSATIVMATEHHNDF